MLYIWYRNNTVGFPLHHDWMYASNITVLLHKVYDHICAVAVCHFAWQKGTGGITVYCFMKVVLEAAWMQIWMFTTHAYVYVSSWYFHLLYNIVYMLLIRLLMWQHLYIEMIYTDHFIIITKTQTAASLLYTFRHLFSFIWQCLLVAWL